jgi:glycosyltransferase involved in cell wall biosynthesis
MTRSVAVIAARDEARHVAATVTALRPIVGEVVVVDDGSADSTAADALGAGATVLRIKGGVGKGGAIEGALERIRAADVYLLADADLGDSARELRPLLDQFDEHRSDLAIAVFPRLSGGGLGIVKRIAGGAIFRLCGFRALEPLSGQRAVSVRCLEAVRPLASGFGLETAMTIDAVRAGFRVVEIPIEGLAHRPTGRSVRGFVHRGRQGWDIARAIGRRLRPHA